MAEALAPLEVANKYLDAYNAFDLDTLIGLMDENIYLIHHNRGFVTEGKEATAALYRGTPDLIPDRQLAERGAVTVDGDRVVVQHVLTGTPKVDLPFGPVGEPFRIDLATVFTVKNGKVVKYEDYG
ncbi:nuclear transport factor 2 family protein [Leucobacter sp. Z1108]|uniref:nuclear transport factor 2 family protein n=1 Tax=Leucobacter sp. Z1108 TaxID=3439066 RepID=UPI003F32263A